MSGNEPPFPLIHSLNPNSSQSAIQRKTEDSDVAKNVAKKLTERQQQIIALITENPYTTRTKIAAKIGVTTKTVERELTALSDLVHYVGSKKGGHWEIIDN